MSSRLTFGTEPMMARPLRLEYPGALWHVTNRGVEQRNIYLDDRDRLRFLALLQKAIAEYRWQLLAFVLLSNHYHLLFETPIPNLSRGMKDLNGDYATAFNLRYQRVGHLFQGRFKSHLVDSDTYLLEVARYLVLNPVRARMVETPGEWRWSSYRPTAGLAAIPLWLDPGPILRRFHPTDTFVAMTRYREFVAARVGQTAPLWEHLVAGAFLGGASFLQMVEERVRARTSSNEHPREQRLFRAATIESVRAAVESVDGTRDWPPKPGSDARAAFVVLAERHTNATRARIGRYLGITGQGVGHLIHVNGARLKACPTFAALVLAAESRMKLPVP